MTFYQIDKDGDFTRAPDAQPTRVESLPPGVYELVSPPMGADYLKPVGKIRSIPKKIYGGINNDVRRIVTTYLDRRGMGLNTGVLMAGLKGSGKSLTTALVANELITKHNGVCIMISQMVSGNTLTNIIGDAKQPVMLDFDEYDKSYGAGKDNANAAQLSLLTFLSGGMSTGVLSVLSVNNTNNIDTHLINRPGRIYYHFRYSGLARATIEAFALDTLDDKSKVADFTTKMARSNEVSFDIMSSVVQEINRYDCSVDDALSIMGFTYLSDVRYKRVILVDGVDVSPLYDMESERPLGRHSVCYDINTGDDIRPFLQSTENPNGFSLQWMSELPRQFESSTKHDALFHLGETGIVVAPVAGGDSRVTVAYFIARDYFHKEVIAVLAEYGYGPKDGLLEAADVTTDKVFTFDQHTRDIQLNSQDAAA